MIRFSPFLMFPNAHLHGHWEHAWRIFIPPFAALAFALAPVAGEIGKPELGEFHPNGGEGWRAPISTEIDRNIYIYIYMRVCVCVCVWACVCTYRVQISTHAEPQLYAHIAII